mgnify:CR=1 FL=1
MSLQLNESGSVREQTVRLQKRHLGAFCFAFPRFSLVACGASRCCALNRAKQALGCVVYELCVLKHAFDANNLLGLVWKIVQESYPPIPAQYSDDLRDTISAMLQKDPNARPSIDEILERPFMKKRLTSLIVKKTVIIKSNLKTGKRPGSSASGSVSGSLSLGDRKSSADAPTPTNASHSRGSGSSGSSAGSSLPDVNDPSIGNPLLGQSQLYGSGTGSFSGSLAALVSPTNAAASSSGSASFGPSGTLRAKASAQDTNGISPQKSDRSSSAHSGSMDLEATVMHHRHAGRDALHSRESNEIGRASCRERG